MKNALRTSTLLSVLLGSAAFAQVRPISPAIINPVAGLPTLPLIAPSPAYPLTGTILRLPSAKPTLLPDMTLALAAAPASARAYAAAAAPATTIVLAAASVDLPAVRMDANRENAGGRLRRAQPWSHRLRLTDKTLKTDGKKNQEALDDLFDRGSGHESDSLVNPLPPVQSGRSIGLPEWDLEREIGVER